MSAPSLDDCLRYIIASWLVCAYKIGREALRTVPSRTTMALRALWSVRRLIPECMPNDDRNAAVGWVPELAVVWLRRKEWSRFVGEAGLPRDEAACLRELYDLLYDRSQFDKNHRKMYEARWFAEVLRHPKTLRELLDDCLREKVLSEADLPRSLLFAEYGVVFTGLDDRVLWVGYRDQDLCLEKLRNSKVLPTVRASWLKAPPNRYVIDRFPDDAPARGVSPIQTAVEVAVREEFSAAFAVLCREFGVTSTSTDGVSLLPQGCVSGLPAVLVCACDGSAAGVKAAMLRVNTAAKNDRVPVLVIGVPGSFGVSSALLDDPSVRAAGSRVRRVLVLDSMGVCTYLSRRVWLWSELAAGGAFRIVRGDRASLAEAVGLAVELRERLVGGAELPVHPAVGGVLGQLVDRRVALPGDSPYRLVRIEGLAQSGKTVALYQVLAGLLGERLVIVLRPSMSGEDFLLLRRLLLWLRAEYGLPFAFGIDDQDRALVHDKQPVLGWLCHWLEEHGVVGERPLVVFAHALSHRAALASLDGSVGARVVSLVPVHDFLLSVLGFWLPDLPWHLAEEAVMNAHVRLGDVPLGVMLHEVRLRMSGPELVRAVKAREARWREGADRAWALFARWRDRAERDDCELFWLLSVLRGTGGAHVPLSLLYECCSLLGVGATPGVVDRALGRLVLDGWVERTDRLVFRTELFDAVPIERSGDDLVWVYSTRVCAWALAHRESVHWPLLRFLVHNYADSAQRQQRVDFLRVVRVQELGDATGIGTTPILLSCMFSGNNVTPQQFVDHVLLSVSRDVRSSAAQLLLVARWRREFLGVVRMSWLFAVQASVEYERGFDGEVFVPVVSGLDGAVGPDDLAWLAGLSDDDRSLLREFVGWLMPRAYDGFRRVCLARVERFVVAGE